MGTNFFPMKVEKIPKLQSFLTEEEGDKELHAAFPADHVPDTVLMLPAAMPRSLSTLRPVLEFDQLYKPLVLIA